MPSLTDKEMKFAIESGIPCAPQKKGKYPFLKMQVGDSFAIPIEDFLNVRQAAFSTNKRHAPMKFSVSQTLMRCWRIA